MAERTFGMPVVKVKDRLQKLAAFEANSAAENFVAATPDYYPVPKNGLLIQNAMAAGNMECTVENIRKIYESLRDKGLLVQRPPEINPYDLDLETLKNLANNTEIHTPEAGDGWDF